MGAMRPNLIPPPARPRKEMVGVDLFLDWPGTDPEELAALLNGCATAELQMEMITDRGVRVWPAGLPETLCTEHCRCRFRDTLRRRPVSHAQVIGLLQAVDLAGPDVVKTESPCTLDGAPGFSPGQGQ